MDLQDKIDAAFLAGFIVGTYDLKGESQPPEFIRAAIDRAMKSSDSTEIEENKSNPIKMDARQRARDQFIAANTIAINEPLEDIKRDANGFGNPILRQPDFEAPFKKARKEWSEEAKIAARERAIANGLGKKKAAVSAGAISPTVGAVSESGNV